jgi:hypothetical protein
MRIKNRRRVVGTALTIALAGTTAGVAATAKLGPFAGLAPTQHSTAAELGQAPLDASQLYPPPGPPPPVTKTVVVPDPIPPEPQRQRAAQPPGADPGAAPPTPAAPPPPSAAPAPHCGDDCESEGDGGGH